MHSGNILTYDLLQKQENHSTGVAILSTPHSHLTQPCRDEFLSLINRTYLRTTPDLCTPSLQFPSRQAYAAWESTSNICASVPKFPAKDFRLLAFDWLESFHPAPLIAACVVYYVAFVTNYLWFYIQHPTQQTGDLTSFELTCGENLCNNSTQTNRASKPVDRLSKLPYFCRSTDFELLKLQNSRSHKQKKEGEDSYL